MHQWHDDTLVAIHQIARDIFMVVELPARQAKMYTSRRSFQLEEQAETFLANQYSTGLHVQYEDILEEIVTRQAWLQRQEEEKQTECDGKLPAREMEWMLNAHQRAFANEEACRSKGEEKGEGGDGQ